MVVAVAPAASVKKETPELRLFWDAAKKRLASGGGAILREEYAPDRAMRLLGRQGHAHGRRKPSANDVACADPIVLDPAMSPVPEAVFCPRCRGLLNPDD